MEYYSKYDKAYIYAAFPERLASAADSYLEQLNTGGVLFWHPEKDEADRKELRRVKAAHAVLVFADKAYLNDDYFKAVINCAVSANKNILMVYLDDAKSYQKDASVYGPWQRMQLNSAQALFANDYPDGETFIAKLKESEIFRNMAVTVEQKTFQKRRGVMLVAIPLIAAALIFALVIYPLVIVSVNRDDFGIKGLTQEELDSIKDIEMVGNEYIEEGDEYGNEINIVFDNKSEQGVLRTWNNNGQEEMTPLTEDDRGNVADLSDLTAMHNLDTLVLAYQNISDLSPAFELKNLSNLQVQYNPIDSIEGAEKLTGLAAINLAGTNVSDITPLTHLANLEYLMLDDTPIRTLPELDCFASGRIRTLSIDGTPITSIPYLGPAENLDFSVQNGAGGYMNYDCLRDVKSFGSIEIDALKLETIRPYLEGKKIRSIGFSSPNITSISDLSGLDITENIAVCWINDMTNLDGIEEFSKVRLMYFEGLKNMQDMTALLNCPNLERVELGDEHLYNMAKEQLQGAKFEILAKY